MKTTRLLSVAALTFSMLCVVSLTGCTRIGPGHVGIKVDMAGSDRGVLNSTATTGWVFYNPFLSTVIEYPTNMQTVHWTKDVNEGKPTDESVTFTNKDSMAINADVNLSYYLQSDHVPAFYVKFLAKDIEDFTDGYLRNITRNCMNDAAGQYEIAQIMGDNSAFLKDAKACLEKQVSQYGVIIDTLGLTGAPRPPQVVLDQINSKNQAQQLALQKQMELLQVQADANKQVAAADGQARAAIAVANGDAQANRIRAASITPVILQNKALDNQHDAIWRWNGQMPSTVVNSGQGSNGLLFNIPATNTNK
jgi:regulator of protease activity HflC (stomatin/prohibitin superfamily)